MHFDEEAVATCSEALTTRANQSTVRVRETDSISPLGYIPPL